MAQDLTIVIGGESGDGVITAGETLTLAAARSGLHVYTYRSFPAEVRGGLAIFQMRLGDREILSQGDRPDILVAFNRDAYDVFHHELRPGAIVIYDPDAFSPELPQGVESVAVPLTRLAKEAIGSAQGKNSVAVGAITSLIGLPLDVVQGLIKQRLGRKTASIAEQNLAAVKDGYDAMCATGHRPHAFERHPGQRHMLLTGNQAIALGAIAAGCRLYAGYPITPATDIMEMLAEHLPRFGGDVVQAEDEMSALAMVIGASYAGKKTMTATSGPGLSLMTELLGLSSMTETPLVLVDVQRVGPSTGIATKPEQSDLNHALFGGHGEFPRVILAPTTVEDCFHLTIRAFNLAEKYQVPVIVLSDQSLAFRQETILRPDLLSIDLLERPAWLAVEHRAYQRYELTPTGVSPRAVPGEQEGLHLTTGLEHDTQGRPTYLTGTRRAMMEKRFRKLNLAAREPQLVAHHGPQHADIGIIGWGSTEGAVREALRWADQKGLKVAALYPKMLNPLPEWAVESFVRSVRTVIVPELNYTGQFANLLVSRYGVQVVRLNKYEGQPLTPQEICDKIEEVA